VALVPQQRGRRGLSPLNVRLTGDLRRIHLAWTPPSDAGRFVIHARPMHAGPMAVRPAAGPRILAEVAEPAYVHTGLSPQGETWEYVVRAVDDWGGVCAQSGPVAATARVSVTVTGQPIASVGAFDGVSSELALARFGYVRYQSTFPTDVDFQHGRDDASTQWSWLQPGPDDAWAGRRTHRFRLRFDLDEQPQRDLDLALWLTDRHPTRAGAAAVLVNGHPCDPLLFVDEAELGTDLRSDVPGHGAGPAYFERPLPAALFQPGENVLEIVKDQGSWIAYDALGVFARSV
jgi:Polysaccharide lyase family 4, domain III